MLRAPLFAGLLFLLACGNKPVDETDSEPGADLPAWITDSPQDRLLAGMSFPGLEAELVEGPPPTSTGAPYLLTPLAGAPQATSIGPGQAFEIAFNYAEVFVNPIDVIIYFDGGSGYFRVRIDLVEGQGQVRIPAEMQDDVCENLAEIIHSIQCNEALQDAGNVADYLIMNLELRCDGSATPTGPTDPGPTGGTGDTGETIDTGKPSEATVPEDQSLTDYTGLYCAIASECDQAFYQNYPDGIAHCQNAVPYEFEGCTYDAVQGAACLTELGDAEPCAGWEGSWRDTCQRVWSYCP